MQRFDALRPADDQDISPADEEAGLHNPRNLVQGPFEVPRPVDACEVHVYNQVACLGLEGRDRSEALRLFAGVLATDQPLDGEDRVLGIGDGLALGDLPDELLARR